MVLAGMTPSLEVPDDDLTRWAWMRGDPESEPLAGWLADRAAERAAFRREASVRAMRSRAADALTAAADVPQQGSPFLGGDAVFSLDRMPGTSQRRIVRRTAQDPAGSAVDVDADGSIDWFFPSPSGRLAVIGLSQGGSERSNGIVIDLRSGNRHADALGAVRHACVSWLPDESGFLYSSYPGDRDYGRELRLHRLGDPQDADALIWENDADSADWPDAEVSASGDLALVHVSIGWTRTDVHLLELRTGARRVVVSGRDALTRLHFTEDDRIVGVTGVDAPRGRLVRVPPDASGPDDWVELLPEGDVVLDGCSVRGDGVFLTGESEMSGRLGHLRLDAEGNPAAPAAWADLGIGDLGIAFPTPGRSLMRDRVVRHLDSHTAVFSWSTMIEPPRLHTWTPGTAPRVLEPLPAATPGPVLRASSVRADDGESIPVLLLEPAAAAGRPLPTLLHGYGGFGLSSTGAYSEVGRAWAALGGRYVVAGLRGGRERGAAWHEAGRLQNRQRVFDDFACVGDALVETGLCGRDQLAIWGSSNGGLLIAATVVQRPDLCAAAHAAVPMTDMLGYHRLSIARLWSGDFGDPDDPADRDWIRAYSPLHNLPDAPLHLPDVIVSTGRNDSRVSPFHAYAFVEALRAHVTPGDGTIVLLAEDVDGGHGVGKPTDAFVDERADVFTLFLHAFARRADVASGGSDSDSL